MDMDKLQQRNWKDSLSDRLTEAIIGYQYRLEQPFPIPSETREMMIAKYQSNYIFHNKVDSLVAGIMNIVVSEIES